MLGCRLNLCTVPMEQQASWKEHKGKLRRSLCRESWKKGNVFL